MTTIHPGTPQDYQKIFPIVQQLRPKLTFEEFSKTLNILNKEHTSFCFVYAQSNNQITGFMTLLIRRNLVSPEGFAVIDDLVVDQNIQRQGIGTKLIDYAKAYALKHGTKKVWLESGFQREGAHAFYQQQGFNKHGFSFLSS